MFCSTGNAQYKDCIDCLDGLALSAPAACDSAMTACAQSSPCAAYAGCLKSCSGG